MDKVEYTGPVLLPPNAEREIRRLEKMTLRLQREAQFEKLMRGLGKGLGAVFALGCTAVLFLTAATLLGGLWSLFTWVWGL